MFEDVKGVISSRNTKGTTQWLKEKGHTDKQRSTKHNTEN